MQPCLGVLAILAGFASLVWLASGCDDCKELQSVDQEDSGALNSPAASTAAAKEETPVIRVVKTTPSGVMLVRIRDLADGAVLPKDLASGSSNPSSESWTPTARDVERFEEGLSQWLNGNLKQSNRIESELPRYWRQYYGTIVDGRRRLQVLLTCERPAGWGEWRIKVADGGLCHLSGFYDVDAGEYHIGSN